MSPTKASGPANGMATLPLFVTRIGPGLPVLGCCPFTIGKSGAPVHPVITAWPSASIAIPGAGPDGISEGNPAPESKKAELPTSAE